ncbi:MAG: helix-turn-helix transcriptional regulator [Cyanobacteria bacterium P01_G01_bin.38]
MSIKPRSADPKQTERDDLINAERLKELSAFLKACRKRTSPETFGLPTQPRRRSPGLSRAEVASLAGISIDWYTWLEQGRNIRPSTQVIDSLSKVFQLTASERRHLYALTNYALSPPESPDTNIELVKHLITYMPLTPAMILSKDWQILAQNACADTVFGTWSHVEESRRNILYLFFTDPIFTQYLRQWEWHAQLAIRQFRPIYATEIGNPVFVRLIEQLTEISPQFREWWADSDVTGRDHGRKEFDHPSLGYLDYDYTILRPAENPSVEVITFIPRTEFKLRDQALRNHLP